MEVRNVSERQTETFWLNKMCEILPPGIQAACINAATLALIDAGIPMKDYVTAVSAGCISGKPVLDINYIEETARGPELTVAILPKTKKITTLEMESRVHADIFEGVLALAIEGCCSIEGILDKVTNFTSPQQDATLTLFFSYVLLPPLTFRWLGNTRKNSPWPEGSECVLVFKEKEKRTIASFFLFLSFSLIIINMVHYSDLRIDNKKKGRERTGKKKA